MMNEPALINKVYSELQRQNVDVNHFVEKVLEQVMTSDDLQDRSDWEEIQRTINLVIKSMDSVEQPLETELLKDEQIGEDAE